MAKAFGPSPFAWQWRIAMLSASVGILGLSAWFGVLLTGFGCYECIEGYNYRVSSEHEKTVVGRIVYASKGSRRSYQYEFSIDGVKMDDSAHICATPLAPGACENYGPVLVHYSYEPSPNSLLESFADASNFSFGVARFMLSIGLPLLGVGGTGFAILAYRQRKKNKGLPREIH